MFRILFVFLNSGFKRSKILNSGLAETHVISLWKITLLLVNLTLRYLCFDWLLQQWACWISQGRRCVNKSTLERVDVLAKYGTKRLPLIIAYLHVTSSHSPVSLVIVLISGVMGKDATAKSASQNPSRSYGFSIPLSDLAKISGESLVRIEIYL